MSDLSRLAEAIARDAGRVLREKFNETRSIDFKGERHTDLVTDADKASEALILSWLHREVPTHGILAEESGSVRVGEYRWFVDPLDGTTNYAHAVPHFCVTLGVEGPLPGGGTGMLAGVVFDPSRNECFVAARGEGAFLDGRRLAASGAVGLRRALMCTGFPYDVGINPDVPLGLFSRIVRQAQGIRRMGSAALDLAYVAAGRFDGFFEFGLKPWDTAAGALLVQEASGVMRSIDGTPWLPEALDVFACAPGVDTELSALCGDFLRSIEWKARRFAAT